MSDKVISIAIRQARVGGDRVSHSAQAIHAASGDLLDEARQARTLDDALQIASIVTGLRERLDAVASLALQRADTLTQ
jgi:hypothetical protein